MRVPASLHRLRLGAPAAVIALVVGLLLALIGPLPGEVAPSPDGAGSLPHSLQGYALYCWRNAAGSWRFTLLYAVNRLRTRDEVENDAAAMMEDVALQKLSALPAGESVAWYAQDGLPDAVVDEIREACGEAHTAVQGPVALSFAPDVR